MKEGLKRIKSQKIPLLITGLHGNTDLTKNNEKNHPYYTHNNFHADTLFLSGCDYNKIG
jgi:hypothetical protein